MCYRPFIFYILFSVFAVWTIKTTPAADSLAPVSAFQPKTREAELQEILANRLGIPDPLDGHTINGMPLQKWLIEKKLVNQLFKKTTGSDRMTAGINPYDDSEIGRGYDRIVSYEKWKAVKERITRYATTYLSPSEAETILTRLNAKGMNSTIWAYVKQEYKGRRRSREPADINNMKFIRAQLSMALNAPYKLSYLSSQPLRRLPIFAEQRPGRIAIQENLWIADPGKPSEWQETARSFSQIASVPLPATQSEAEQLLADVTNQQPSLRTGDSPPQYAPRVRRENGHIIVRRFDMDEAGEIAIKDISFNSLWEAVHSTYVREIDSCLETLQMINETITFIERRSQSDETFSESEFQNLPLVSQMAKSPKNERWGKKKQQIHEIVQEAIRGGDATPLKEKMQRIRTAHCDMIRHIRSRIIPELHEFAKRRDHRIRELVSLRRFQILLRSDSIIQGEPEYARCYALLYYMRAHPKQDHAQTIRSLEETISDSEALHAVFIRYVTDVTDAALQEPQTPKFEDPVKKIDREQILEAAMGPYRQIPFDTTREKMLYAAQLWADLYQTIHIPLNTNGAKNPFFDVVSFYKRILSRSMTENLDTIITAMRATSHGIKTANTKTYLNGLQQQGIAFLDETHLSGLAEAVMLDAARVLDPSQISIFRRCLPKHVRREIRVVEELRPRPVRKRRQEGTEQLSLFDEAS